MMASHSAITLAFGDGEHVFDVGPLGVRLELEEKCGCGLLAILRRLNDDSRVHDYREPVRLGLIGGGLSPSEALKLVVRYVDTRPAMESVPVARAIVMAALVGVAGDDVVGKGEAERATTEAAGSTASTAASSAPPSTASAPPSDSRPATSTPSRSGSSPPASTAGTPPTARKPSPSRPATTISTG